MSSGLDCRECGSYVSLERASRLCRSCEKQGGFRCTCPMREPLDADVLAAMDDGELTQEQLRRLIVWEAGQMGLSFDQAVECAENGALPKTALGSDVDLLLRMYQPPADCRAAGAREQGRG